MARTYPEITAELRRFIARQHCFFVASAPSEGGHVNLSPKGLDSLRVLDGRRVAYLDLTGSGNETSAHLAENGRLTIMFCAFAGPPRILRLYGRGSVVLPDSPEWEALAPNFTMHPGARQIITLDVERVQTSCGYAVPLMSFETDRDVLDTWTANKGPEGLEQYRRQKNAVSLDGQLTPIGARLAADQVGGERSST